jgi:AcrR family transcriptional regulator
MPTRSRASGRMSSAQRREQLLDVTTQLVIKQGFHGVSIEAVSQAAGVTRALVYQHFEDLEVLLKAVVAREMQRALSQVTETELTNLGDGEPRELMLDSLRAFLSAVRDHPTTWRLVLMPPEGTPPAMRRSVARGRARVRARLAAAVRPALGAGRDRKEAELTANVLSAISDEYARMVLTDPRRYPPQRLLQHARWLLEHPAAAGE